MMLLDPSVLFPRCHVPAQLVSLTAADLEGQGLYNLLRANGITMRIAKQSIGARAATAVGSNSQVNDGSVPVDPDLSDNQHMT